MKPTPETDAEEANDNGDTKPLFEFARTTSKADGTLMALSASGAKPGRKSAPP